MFGISSQRLWRFLLKSYVKIRIKIVSVFWSHRCVPSVWKSGFKSRHCEWTAYLYRLRSAHAAAFIDVSLCGKALISSQVAISSKQTSVISTFALILSQRAAKGASASHLTAVKAHSHGALNLILTQYDVSEFGETIWSHKLQMSVLLALSLFDELSHQGATVQPTELFKD